MKLNVVAASLLLAVAIGGTASAEPQTLRLVSAYPETHNFNASLMALVDEVNSDPDSDVTIDFVGGPEALPSGEMMQALKSGVVDLFYGASSLFVGDIPESLALNGSNLSASELRERGAFDKLSESFEERANAKYLGYFGSGYTFYVYLLKEPPRTEDGGVDLSGWRIRGGAPYKSFLDRLGANMVTLFPPEIYSAMERGVIDGLIWTSVSVVQEGWDEFIKYRIVPGWRQGDISLQANLDSWNALTEEQQAALTQAVAKYEAVAHEAYKKQAEEDLAVLRKAGMQDIVLEGEAREEYLDAAVGRLWEDLKVNVPEERAEELKNVFYAD